VAGEVKKESHEIDKGNQDLLALSAEDAKLSSFQEKQGSGRTLEKGWKVHEKILSDTSGQDDF